MKHTLVVVTVSFILLLAASYAAAIEGRLMRYPDIHGDRVVFTYEDDLWSAPVDGGPASRLTSHPGIESHASFSPDGAWIAFTGSYDGGYDVYVMPTGGGEPTRLTYHPAYDRVVGWMRDGTGVLFVSRRTLQEELYRVHPDGGFPVKLPLDRVSYASLSPDGDAIAINRFNTDRMNWKGYKGGRQQDIWIADIEGTRFEKITDWEGYDNRPMWHGDQVYFNADREDGRMNIYVYDLKSGDITRCTRHAQWDVEFPAIGEDRIVYGCEGYLRVYDILTDRSVRLAIDIPSDRWRMRDTYVSPGGYLQEIGLGPDGSTCVVQARGDIYLLDTEKERAVNITRTPSSRELHPALSPGGDTIAFFSDRGGEYDLYISPADPGGEWTQIPTGLKTYFYEIHWSPDGSKLLFGDKDYAVYIADIAARKTERIDRCRYQKDNEIFWEWSDYSWSPDGRWVVYSAVEENLNSSVFLYSLETGKIHRVTDDRYDDYSPCFDPAGEHIYFLSLRNFAPELDWFMDNNINTDMSRIMAVQLKAGERPPFYDIETENDAAEPGAAAGADTANVSPADSTVIELDGIAERIFTVPVKAGTYRALTAYEGHIAYLSRDGYGFPGIQEFLHPKSVTHYDLHVFDTDKEEDRTVIEGIGFYALSGDGARAAYLSGMLAGVVKTDSKSSVGDGSLTWGGLQQKIDVFKEYPQIYRDVWRQIRDFFYDPDLHGKDWKAVYRKYEALIPFVATRADMNYIIGHMIGELTASHEYIIGRGGPPRTFYPRTNVGLLGADLAPDGESGRYRFSHIIEDSRWNEEHRGPLREPHIDVREGDYLLAIDGREVTTADNYLMYLENTAGDEITITVGRTPDPDEGATYRIKPIGGEFLLRYHERIERNYRTVRRETDGRVGYMHLLDMDERGIQQFERAFRAERYRDGLIIDVRSNGGGFVSWFMIDKLERALAFMTVTRDFEPMRYPHGVHAGPIVVLCDENTGSDGEVFTQHFKDLGLGTVIGTPTWGGLIGIINMIPLTDGGMVTQSNVGFADLTGRWIVENRGAIPDIVVENDPADLVRGRDRQLEEAIRVITEMLRYDPPPELEPPAFPVK